MPQNVYAAGISIYAVINSKIDVEMFQTNSDNLCKWPKSEASKLILQNLKRIGYKN